jgi:DNA repair exonuclease SbcCD ATPase subunit
LHVLEAYQDLRQQLNQKEETVEELKEELKQSHTRDIKEFENLATQWEEKEEDYKSEIKKLEVLLSKTKDGMEKVSLARSKSRVHGSRGAAESITWGIDTIKARHAARNSIYGGWSSGSFFIAMPDFEADQPETDSSVYSMQPGIQGKK